LHSQVQTQSDSIGICTTELEALRDSHPLEYLVTHNKSPPLEAITNS